MIHSGIPFSGEPNAGLLPYEFGSGILMIDNSSQDLDMVRKEYNDIFGG